MVVNALFNPFTFQEMLAPVLMATQAHNDMLDQYGEIANKASIWEGMLDLEKDKDVYGKYKDFQGELDRITNDMASNGLNPQSRKHLINMRNRYNSDIVPIETAYNKRNEFINKQLDANLRDQTLMFNKDFSNISLSEMMANPSLTFKSVSGNELTKQVAALAERFSNEIMEDPRQLKGILDTAFGPQYYDSLVRSGYSPQLIFETAMGSEKGSAILKSIVDSVVDSSGVADFGEDQLTKAREYANRGLYAAIGGQKRETLKNNMFDVAAQDYMMRRKAALEAEPPVQDTYDYVDVVEDISYVELPEIKLMSEDLEFIKEYQSNPLMIELEDKLEFKGKNGVLGFSPVHINNKAKLKRMQDEYGTVDPIKIQEAINDKITKTAEANKVYNLQIAKNDMVTKFLRGRALSGNNGSNTLSGILVIGKNGKVKDTKMTIGDFNEILKGDYVLAATGAGKNKLSGYNEDGDLVELYLDDKYMPGGDKPVVYKDKNGRKVVLLTYKSSKKAAVELSNKGDYEGAHKLFIGAMGYLYDALTNIAEGQTETVNRNKIQ